MPETATRTRTYRFDEMAVLVRDKIDNPAEANVDRYVGLEHLDPESLKIRRWGKTSDVEATKLVFKAGDIIFGKRRVYQRKLAVADFDGICSAHAMVLRPKPDVVLPEFLPFFMQSDLFMERAIEISVGSLSPTINWKTLAMEEFALPPLDEQRRIAEVLQAAEHNESTLTSLIGAMDAVTNSIYKEHFLISRREKAASTVGDVAKVRNGTTPRRSRREYWGGNIPWLTTGKVNERHIQEADEFITDRALEECSLSVIPSGSTLVAMIGQGATRGRVALLGMDATINQNFAALTSIDGILPRFLYYQLDALYEGLRQWSQGSNQLALNCHLVSIFPIWVPDKAKQQEVIDCLDLTNQARELLAARGRAAKGIRQKLLENRLKGVIE